MSFFTRKREVSRQDGLTPDTAFKLPSIGSGSAISIEYKTLGKLFGREGSDFKIHDRIRSREDSGRHIEKFILGTRDGRKVIHFDITDVLQSPDPEPVQEVIEAVMSRQRDRLLLINLPTGVFLMLYKIMEDVGSDVTTAKFDPANIINYIMATASTHDIEKCDQLPLTLSVADWVHVLSVTRMIEVQSIQAQEFVNDLRAYIEGALKKAGPG